jgi:secreted PhoX family phosphatase
MFDETDHQHDDGTVRSTEGKGQEFGEVLENRLSRRSLLIGGLSLTVSALVLKGCNKLAPAKGLSFGSVLSPATATLPKVPDGYEWYSVIRWGDPILPNTAEFIAGKTTRKDQNGQFGYNCDFVGFLPKHYEPNRGFLAVNHEYTNAELMFPGYSSANPTKDQVDVELAAHGMSIVELEKTNEGWKPVKNSRYNRRLTAETLFEVTGPAAGADWMKTTADPTGTRVLGTLNNCSGGKTPWGTVLSGEENFQMYFAHNDKVADEDKKKAHERYGVEKAESRRKWERFHSRFDLTKEPNEPFRQGWVIEVDPEDPTAVPKKRTSLGRFRHEAATTVVTKSGKVAVYSGDDAKFEYVYKFVSANPFNPNDRAANMNLLDEGTLYVAKFNEDGSGEWLPLVFGQGPLTAANGFNSQADVLINTRRSADLLGATKMDRPEDIEASPVTGKVYVVLTKNDDRGKEGKQGADKANPRADNKAGHIVELIEKDGDHASTTFAWDMFLVCGDPKDEGTYFAGFPKDKISPIACPDNLTFDNDGNLWIATDGMEDALEVMDGLFAVPTEGEERGYLRQFFSSVNGGEVCGPEFTPDNETLFLAIQHPGSGSTYENPSCRFPDYNNNPPRPTVIGIRKKSGGKIGS